MRNIRDNAKNYLKLRRKLGYKLIDAERLLNQFLIFMKNKKGIYVKLELAIEWATNPKNTSPRYQNSRLNVIRKFSEYCKMIDNRNEQIPNKLINSYYQRLIPYIYTNNEIKRLLDASLIIKSPGGFRGKIYYTIFGLLAVTGARIRELTSIMLKDVNLKQGLITLTDTKSGEPRIIPIHRSTVKILQEYLDIRNKINIKIKPDNLFLLENGQKASCFAIRAMFVRLSKKIGLRKATDTHGPRIHDFRHTFVVNTITQWYKEGVNVEVKLPILSTYLGHKKPSDTYWYLSAIPELVALTAKRLEKYVGGLK